LTAAPPPCNVVVTRTAATAPLTSDANRRTQTTIPFARAQPAATRLSSTVTDRQAPPVPARPPPPPSSPPPSLSPPPPLHPHPPPELDEAALHDSRRKRARAAAGSQGLQGATADSEEEPSAPPPQDHPRPLPPPEPPP
jgi:hypothetical protein